MCTDSIGIYAVLLSYMWKTDTKEGHLQAGSEAIRRESSNVFGLKERDVKSLQSLKQIH